MLWLDHAAPEDRAFWFSLDRHMAESEFLIKLRERRCYLLKADGQPIGILRYNLFWDNTPFLTLLVLREGFRRKGYGRQAMLLWEDEMRSLGYPLVMTSTQADEGAQHFYRKLGYKDTGCLVLDVPGSEQPLEILMLKVL
ncbi:MAG: GNAT family N-acetyltransferase [Candidatus Limiplasma sp.]|nr:GNAT family N-acetyltransferase [Candidatus Limiplasma sp.]